MSAASTTSTWDRTNPIHGLIGSMWRLLEDIAASAR